MINLIIKNNHERIYFAEQLAASIWNKFLFDFTLSKIEGHVISSYNDTYFGSWNIDGISKRVIYDGRESWVVFQDYINGNWVDGDFYSGKPDYDLFINSIKKYFNG